MKECILFTLFSLHMLFKSRSIMSEDLSINSTNSSQKQYEIKVVPEDIYLLGADSAIFSSNSSLHSAKFLEGKVRELESQTFFDLRNLNSNSDVDIEK